MIEVAIGIGVGVVYGVFGGGASAFATPLLALAGVPPLVAVASPLPATIPAALAGAWTRRREVPAALLRRCAATALPAAVAGGLASSFVGGTWLLVLTAAVIALAGWQLLATGPDEAVAVDPRLTDVAIAGVGFLAGLLANSGGVLLVPVFVVLAGLTMRQATASSLLVAAALAVPAVLTHAALGHVDWRVAALFAAGLVPGTAAGTRLAEFVPCDRVQRAFGVLLVLFAGWYVVQLMP